MKNKPVIIIGAGGHARVLIDILRLKQRELIGLVSKEKNMNDVAGAPLLGDDGCLVKYPPDSCELINGVGSVGDPGLRMEIFTRFKRIGYVFSSAIHPSAILGSGINLGEGIQIMAGAVIQPECTILDNSIINTRASLDHHCYINPHCHIAPGAVLSGGVKIGEASHIGAGAVIIQGVTIGSGCLVSAGAAVLSDVPDGQRAMSNPARIRPRQ